MKARKARRGPRRCRRSTTWYGAMPAQARRPTIARNWWRCCATCCERLHGGLAQRGMGGGRARAVHVQPRRGARRGGEAEPGLDAAADRGGGRSAATAAAERQPPRATSTTATKARALAEAMAPRAAAHRSPSPQPEPESRIALPKSLASLERGMWVEFEGEDGHLAFAKLAWVSPLRGTYLFTNRQGQKAVSLTADELAERFRNDRARSGRSRAAGRSRLRQHDGDARREVRQRIRRSRAQRRA